MPVCKVGLSGGLFGWIFGGVKNGEMFGTGCSERVRDERYSPSTK
jgi:hypothetical protein